MPEKLLKELYEATIQQVEAVYNLAKDYNMLNRQITLDFLDKLNEISVKN